MLNTYRIYCYTNQVTGQKYVGCTCRKYQSKRAGKNGSGYSKCPFFWQAIELYGWDNFQYEVLEDNLNKEQSELRERYWIETLNTICPNGYNLDSGGLKDRNLHESTKEKLSERMSNVTKTDEWKQHLSESMKGKNTWAVGNTNTRGRKWWNNGIKSVMAYECPEGFVSGRL